jgi:hypothetical protein
MSSTGYLSTKGVTLEANLRFAAKATTCWTKSTWGFYKGTGQTPIFYTLYGDETALQNIVATYGPAVVAIHSSSSFQSYRSGVFTRSGESRRIPNP